MTRKQIMVHIFLHTPDKTHICGLYQRSTEATFKRDTANQQSFVAQCIVPHHMSDNITNKK